MKSYSMMLLAIVVIVLSMNLSTPRAQGQSRAAPPKPVSLMGCLVKGDKPKEVWLAKHDGAIYGLVSSKIELTAHLGHKVIVRGYVVPEGTEDAGGGTQQNKASGPETADFRVLTLKMVSTTCTQ